MLTGQLISKAACKMEICEASENTMVEFFVAKSEHASFAQLFDLRTGGGGGSVGVIYGARLDQLDSSKWNREGIIIKFETLRLECFK